MSKLENTQEMKYVWLMIIFNYFVLQASVGVSYVATQFYVSNNDGRMSKGVKTSQRCGWFVVTSRNVSSKINAKPSKVQIPISFLILWIFWSNKNEFTLYIMACLKVTESQNGQIYPRTHFPMARLIYNLSFKHPFDKQKVYIYSSDNLLFIALQFNSTENANWQLYLVHI